MAIYDIRYRLFIFLQLIFASKAPPARARIPATPACFFVGGVSCPYMGYENLPEMDAKADDGQRSAQ